MYMMAVGKGLWSQLFNQYLARNTPQSIPKNIVIFRSYFAVGIESKLFRNSYITGKFELKSKSSTSSTMSNSSTSRPDGLTYASDQVVTEKMNDITLIAINRPESRNAVNRETARQLKQAFINFDKDKYAHVAVLYGKGGTFCAGYDLKELSSGNVDLLAEPPQIPFGPMGPSTLQLSKPVIAAVDGHAVAGGLELSLFCDMRVAEESAVFGVFCRRFGVPLIDGGTVRLPKLIGLSRAMDMILTGRPVKADEALSFGLVNRVVPDGQGLDKAIELAKQIAAFPQRCMRADRLSAYYSTYESESLKDAMDFEYKTGSPVVLQESVQGAARFAQGQGRKGSFDDPKSKL
ncbi:enoyl-CoA hydratase EchA19-like isoform X1 [Amphiura filiformis]|uniref:enoyl-CoA hydratase EchA19-like isoform X1 n=1 Tax=Amphiura filiformis TaxID=82378 RepID=UPI003B2188B5